MRTLHPIVQPTPCRRLLMVGFAGQAQVA